MKNIFRIYNGTNHKVSIYHFDPTRFTRDRNSDGYVINDDCTAPDLVLSKMTPLDVKIEKGVPVDMYGLSVSYPVINQLSAETQNLIAHLRMQNYDAIVVSSTFANAMRVMGYQDAAFLDRLYVPGRLVYNSNHEIIGSLSLQRAFPVMRPMWYLNNMAYISMLSAAMCVKAYQDNQNYYLLEKHDCDRLKAMVDSALDGRMAVS